MADALIPAVPILDPQAYDANGELFFWSVFNNEPVSGAAATVDSVVGAPNVGGKARNGLVITKPKLFGAWFIFTGTTINVTLHILQSKDDVAANFVIPATGDPALAITDLLAHAINVAPVPLPYLRWRAVAGVGNTADVKLSLVMWGQS